MRSVTKEMGNVETLTMSIVVVLNVNVIIYKVYVKFIIGFAGFCLHAATWH